MVENRMHLRLSPVEKSAFERAAELAGLSLSAWVRERLRETARKELQAEGEVVPFLASKKSKRRVI
jgi:uncharacterized protein (DUF1778 family)